MKKIKVLIIDDSAVVRQLLTKILSTDEEIEVVGVAMDPYVAREKIKKLNPDVLTLDVEMPKMDGISFLKNLMRLHPLPVIMISSLTKKGADVALEALGLGAIDCVAKPSEDIIDNLQNYSSEIIAKVKAAAATNQTTTNDESVNIDDDLKDSTITTERALINKFSKHKKFEDVIIAIGASTGGTEAIKEILLKTTSDTPAIIISQHIPSAFSTAFSNRMNTISKMTVCEASNGQRVQQGHAYIAPGDQHLLLKRENGEYYCYLNNGKKVNRHRPSVDVMFDSVAQEAGKNAIGVLLTGMGADGAAGLKTMRNSGASTIAQDEKSSIVWGMPGEAVKRDAADFVLSIEGVASTLSSIKQSPD